MVGAIVQARLGSTRLPRKILAPLAGQPLLQHIVDRTRASKSVGLLVVATTVNPQDDELVVWCEERGLAVFRGSSDDVLGRFYGAASQYGMDVVARITSDDPFKDPQILDAVVSMLTESALDFACNNHPPSFPEGLDTEVFTFSALSRAHDAATDPFEREHVTQYFYRHPEQFRQMNLSHTSDISSLRWTIDTPLDLAMAQRVYDELYRPGQIFLMEDILALLARNPEIARVNSSVDRSAMYKTPRTTESKNG
jgi:spore coat polysaccharide biosynthesis protein SpsF